MPARAQPSINGSLFYFEVHLRTRCFVIYGREVDETRHIWMKKGDQAVLSPNGLFIVRRQLTITPLFGVWVENLDYGDQDFSLDYGLEINNITVHSF